MKPLFLIACLLLASCDRTTPTEPGPMPSPGPTIRFIDVTGDNQTIRLHLQQPEPLTARLVQTNGTAVPGARVRFDIPTGEGYIEQPERVTDSDGFVRCDVSPRIPGALVVRATAQLPESTRVSFRLDIQ